MADGNWKLGGSLSAVLGGHPRETRLESIQLSQLWTAAAVLAGFQVTALTWRLNREVAMEFKSERTWVTLPDGFVASSFLIVVVGVFAAPLSGTATTEMAAKLFGIAMLVFAASPFVLAGHYNLYCSWGKNGPRTHVTKQERTAAGVTTLLCAGGAWWILA